MCSTDLTLEHGHADATSTHRKQAMTVLQAGNDDAKCQQHTKHDEGCMLQ